MTIRQALQGAGFKAHNNKSQELVASKFHSSIRNVRIVVNTATDKNTGKLIAGKQAQFKAVYINNQSQWRTIATGTHFKPGAFKSEIPSKLIAIEAGAESAATCKCGAKKFKAKSGNVVCADACWANRGWSPKRKKWQGTKKKNTSQPRPQKRAAEKKIPQIKKERKVEGTYRTFFPGQLVKVKLPPPDTLSDFVGTVTKTEPVGSDPNRPLVNVFVLWMHSGKIERMSNYQPDPNSEWTSPPYLVPVA